jgi:membrane associated rhomboid family serine protease
MQVHVPDPRYTDSWQARANFRVALKISFAFVWLIWIIHLASWGLDLELPRFGVAPREWSGLPGILFAPLLHGSFAHIIANSVPLLVLGTGMLYLYPKSAMKVIPIVYLGSGLAVWLFGRPSFHIGASGLVYGLVSYIFFAGIIRRDKRAIAAALLVSFMYGTLAWGVLPIERGVSWETHLAAALIGAALAACYRHLDLLPRRRYTWEDEEVSSERDDGQFAYAEVESAWNGKQRADEDVGIVRNDSQHGGAVPTSTNLSPHRPSNHSDLHAEHETHREPPAAPRQP